MKRWAGFVIGLSASPALAQSTAGPELLWTAPANCPQEAGVRERLRSIIGGLNVSQSRLRAEGEVTQVDGHFHLKLVVHDGELVGERSLDSDSCEDLAGATAVALGLLLRSESPLTERDLSGGEATEATAPPPSASVESGTPRSHSAIGQPPRQWRFVLRVPGLTARVAQLPKPSLGLTAAAGVDYAAWRVLLSGVGWLDQRVYGTYQPGSGAQVSHATLTFGVSRGFRFDQLEWGPALALSLEHFSARGFGAGVEPSRQRSTFAGVGLGAFAAWHVAQPFSVVAEAGAHVQTARPILAIDGLGEVRQLGLVAVQGSLAAEWRL